MLEVINVTKRYYTLTALDNVSFTLPRGEVLGLLGPNGAGKTSLLKLVAGFIRPDSGEVRPTGPHWPAIGLKPERLLYPNSMRVEEYLRLVAGLCPIRGNVNEAVHQALAQVNLLDAARKRIKDCSKGMRQRLGLAQVLIGDPPLLLLDEPSNGLDPEGQAAICQLIKDLHALGKTILLSSHQLAEVTQTCTRLVILNHGRVYFESSMAEALTLRPHVTIEAAQPLDEVAGLLQALAPGIEVHGSSVILHDEAIRMRRYVLTIIVGAGIDIIQVVQKRVTLEEIYAQAVAGS